MEQRQSRRYAANEQIMVYDNGVLVAAGEMVDISERGLYMQLYEDLSGGLLRAGALVDILLDDPDVPPRERQLSAEVVRTEPGGIGVMFLHHCGIAAYHIR
jgi:hypothetical protein